MPLREFLSWRKFRQKRGSLHLGMRIERGAGLIASVLVNANRDRTKYPDPLTAEDFMPHADEVAWDLETAMKDWR